MSKSMIQLTDDAGLNAKGISLFEDNFLLLIQNFIACDNRFIIMLTLSCSDNQFFVMLIISCSTYHHAVKRLLGG